MVAQDAAVPLLVKYLPDAPDCEGTTYTDDVSRLRVTAPDVPPPVRPVPADTAVMSAAIATQDALVPSVVRYSPECPV